MTLDGYLFLKAASRGSPRCQEWFVSISKFTPHDCYLEIIGRV